MSVLEPSGRIWLTAFWGFDPENEGVLGFTAEGDRDRFMATIDERQLVCIYGAASEETARKDVHQLLGILDLERTPIDSWSKSSQFAIDRNIRLKRDHKWRFAVSVKRAWRTTHNLDVGKVLPLTYNPNAGRYISKF
jgi:hypothetical protein